MFHIFHNLDSQQEFPFVRYRAAKSLDPNTMTTFRDLIPTKLAAGIWNCLMKYKAKLPNFPQQETCELLILDRSVDQVFFPTFLIFFYCFACISRPLLSESSYIILVSNLVPHCSF